MAPALRLVVLPVLVSELGQGIREYLRRKEQSDTATKLEARIAELERWRHS